MKSNKLQSKFIFIFFIIIGGIIGVLVVRYFVLNPVQIIGWKLFWNYTINYEFININRIFTSETFLRCVTGFIIGGLIGYIISVIILETKKTI